MGSGQSKYHDRFSVDEALTHGALTMLMEASLMGDYEHKPLPQDVEDIEEDMPHIVKERWIRNECEGGRVEPFYGLNVWVSRKSSSPGGSANHFPAGRVEWEDRYRVDPENNMHETKCIGDVGVRFECPIEAFHKVVTHAVTVFPCFSCMTTKQARINPFQYEQKMEEIRAQNHDGKHDPYIMLVSLDQLTEENKVYKRGGWGWFLKHNPHNYKTQ